MSRLLTSSAIGMTCMALSPAWAAVDNESAKLIASDGAQSDNFGRSVAVAGNIGLVGAAGDDDDGLQAGSAYLFDVTTGTQTFKLLPSDGAAANVFGSSVGLSSTTAIVGAYGADATGVNLGAAYLFDVATGLQFDRLQAADAANGDLFGYAVAISETTVIIGAPGRDDNGQHSGCAYLFDAATGTQLAKCLPDDGAEEDWAGWAVAIDGPLAVVGARLDDDNGSSSGSAYLFDSATGAQLAKLLPDDGDGQDLFGAAVAISANTVLIGAPQDDDNGPMAGAAYLFDVSNPFAPVQIAKLLAADGQFLDAFGAAVALSGDIALVGAEADNVSGDDDGSAYLFDVTTASQLAKLIASDHAANDELGGAVALQGGKVIVGARGDDESGSHTGAAYLFDVPPPCAPTSYCTVADGSVHNTATLGISSCKLAATITLDLAGGPAGQFCYLLIGDGSGSATDPPGAQGDLCLAGGASIGRYAKDAGTISAAGSFSTDIEGSLSGGPGYGIPDSGGQSIQAGSTWNFQYWHRRPAGQASGFSEALRVTFQ